MGEAGLPRQSSDISSSRFHTISRGAFQEVYVRTSLLDGTLVNHSCRNSLFDYRDVLRIVLARQWM